MAVSYTHLDVYKRQSLDSDASSCLLFTQLSNPTSNAVYQRIGYEPVMEIVRYRFG